MQAATLAFTVITFPFLFAVTVGPSSSSSSFFVFILDRPLLPWQQNLSYNWL